MQRNVQWFNMIRKWRVVKSKGPANVAAVVTYVISLAVVSLALVVVVVVIVAGVVVFVVVAFIVIVTCAGIIRMNPSPDQGPKTDRRAIEGERSVNQGNTSSGQVDGQ